MIACSKIIFFLFIYKKKLSSYWFDLFLAKPLQIYFLKLFIFLHIFFLRPPLLPGFCSPVILAFLLQNCIFILKLPISHFHLSHFLTQFESLSVVFSINEFFSFAHKIIPPFLSRPLPDLRLLLVEGFISPEFSLPFLFFVEISFLIRFQCLYFFVHPQ